jgi:hypothetical protein
MALLGFRDWIRSMRKSGSGLPALKIEIPDKKGLAVLIAVERAEELDGTPKPHSELLVSVFPGRGSDRRR